MNFPRRRRECLIRVGRLTVHGDDNRPSRDCGTGLNDDHVERRVIGVVLAPNYTSMHLTHLDGVAQALNELGLK